MLDSKRLVVFLPELRAASFIVNPWRPGHGLPRFARNDSQAVIARRNATWRSMATGLHGLPRFARNDSRAVATHVFS